MNHLVDTDWIIDALSGIQSALAPLEHHAVVGVAVSVITLGELYEGAYNFPNPDAHMENLRLFLSGFTVLELNDAIMQVFGQNRHSLRRQGNLIPDLDLLIAATALHYDLTLMTRNLRHFARIPGLRLYQPPRRPS